MSSSEKQSLKESIGVGCFTFLNSFNGLPPIRCVGESGVIKSGNCCSKSKSSFFKESKASGEISSLSKT